MVAPIIPIAIGAGMAGGGIAGSLFGKKKAKPIDITAQLKQVQDSTMRSRGRVDDLYDALQPKTEAFKNESMGVLNTARETAGAERDRFLTETDDLTKQSKDLLRANLYSDTFQGLPDALRAVREASAAGSGIDSGAYQQAVQNVGRDTASNLVRGERDIQIEGLKGQQDAQRVAYQTFGALSSKLDDQQLDLLAKVLDTGREDMVRRTASQIGLDESETQAIVDLLNFRASGNLAAQTSADEQRQQLYNALIGGGSMLMGSMKGGK